MLDVDSGFRSIVLALCGVLFAALLAPLKLELMQALHKLAALRKMMEKQLRTPAEPSPAKGGKDARSPDLSLFLAVQKTIKGDNRNGGGS